MSPEAARKLADLQIDVSGEGGDYLTFTRGICAALARRTAAGLSLGSSGIMTEHGLAYLVERDGRAWLAAKGAMTDPAPEQLAEIRKFSEDLKSALAGW